MTIVGKTLLSRYKIIRKIGSGGFGDTYLAQDIALPSHPQCVVKQLKPKDPDPKVFPIAKKLFQREAEFLYRLGEYEQIPRLYAHFEEEGEFYLVEEFVDGDNLGKEIIPGKRLSEKQTVHLLQEILEVLAVVHQHGIIHRDIKPENIMRRKRDGKLILIDFGAVKQLSALTVDKEGQTSLTVSIGSPGYMPSEQALGRPKLASDVYAVGTIGIIALTGTTPERFSIDPNTGEIIWRKVAPQVSDRFADVLDTMIRDHFTQRFASATEALRELNSIVVAPRHPTIPIPSKASKSSIVPVIVALAVAVLTGYVALKIFIVPVAIALTLAVMTGYVFINRSSGLVNILYSRLVRSKSKSQRTAEYWYAEGNKLLDTGHQLHAIASYDKAIEIKPDFPEAWHSRGVALFYLQRYDEAIASYDKAIEIKPDFPEAWNSRGIALQELKLYHKAIASYDKAIKIKPNFHKPWNGRGDALFYLQRYDEAIASYDKAIKIKPDYYKPWHNRGFVLENLKRYQEAIVSYDKAIEINPDYHEAWNSRGNVLYELKQYSRALASYDKAIEIKPDYHEAWNGRGDALYELKRYNDALPSYDKAIEIKPDFQLAKDNREIILTKLGIN